MEKGKFIVIEGLDGCGKSTQLELIKKWLDGRGVRVHLTAEPTNYETGAYLRQILSECLDKDMYLQAALFLADRLEHITNPEFGINKYLADGCTVICDRYYFSTFAYQGTKCDMDWVMDINLKCRNIIKPDLTIFLDVDPDTCKDRIDTAREKPELYEKDIEGMRRIRANFLTVLEKLSQSHNISVIDANTGVEAVHNAIVKEISKIF